MKLHRSMFVGAVLVTAAFGGSAAAQSPGTLYTWDHAFGSGVGPNVEGWGFAFGGAGQSAVLANAGDGVLTVTEGIAGGDWAIADGFNFAKESAAAASGGFFDFGGVDLLGLTQFELDIAHNGSSSISGQLFLQPDNGSGCCGFFTSTPFSVAPGASNTVTVDFSGSGITPEHLKYVRTVGVQVFGHTEAAPLTWEIGAVRTVGTPLAERVIADYTVGSGLQNVVVKFDQLAVSGGSANADTQQGLSQVGGALRWVDLGGTGDAGDESGAAVAWGNGNALAVDFLSRPLDISNYDFAEVVIRATPGAGAASEVNVQLYAQYADRDASNAFNFGGTSLTLPADGQFHTLNFPLAALEAGGDLDLTQWVGLNLDPHAGGAFDIRVQSVVLKSLPIPEPSATAIFGSALLAFGRRARRAGC